MNQEEAGAVVSTVLSVGSGVSSYLHVFDKLNYYAPLIGIILSFTFGMFGAYFVVKSYKKEKKADINEKRIIQTENKMIKIETKVCQIQEGIEFIKEKVNQEQNQRVN